MKNFQDSDYALNKYSKGIVYRFTDRIVEITQTEFLAENPGKTPADFQAIKAMSDAIYLEQVRLDTAQGRKAVPISVIEDTELCSVRGADYSVIEKPEEMAQQNKRHELGKKALDKLTKVQRRRYVMYRVKGLSTYEIAEAEGKNQKTVYESLQSAEKKIQKFLADA